jgi:hypothetical protein
MKNSIYINLLSQVENSLISYNGLFSKNILTLFLKSDILRLLIHEGSIL